MCLIILNKVLITGTEDGSIYVWKSDIIKKT
jgi:hypothetical protein